MVITQRGKLLKNFMMGKVGAKAALTEFDTVKLKAVKSLMKVSPLIVLTQYIIQLISCRTELRHLGNMVYQI